MISISRIKIVYGVLNFNLLGYLEVLWEVESYFLIEYGVLEHC